MSAMAKRLYCLLPFLFTALFSLSIQATAQAAAQAPRRFSLNRFENNFCRGKARLQDCSDSPVMDQVLAGGKSSVAVLISQLTETHKTDAPVEDFWSYTTSGDVAFILLTDLFTDKDGASSTLPQALGWGSINAGCDNGDEGCWRKYVRDHGIRTVQQSWQNAWQANQDRIVWDSDARCFRIAK
jgi:hypothetical protein